MAERLVILGAGESGVGSAVLGLKMGYDVFVSDFGAIKPAYREELGSLAVEFEEGMHSAAKILNADIVIKSPGIPDKAPMVKACIEKGIPVISEIEFAGRFTNAKMICITGSNGKTTTTLLIYEILKRAGLNVGLAGNVGFSFARQVANENFDFYVLELSSFQLDGMYSFKADVAIMMNITPDHLDRYGYELQNYIDSKFRIIQNQGRNDYFIYFADDPIIVRELEQRKPEVNLIPFSVENSLEKNSAFLSNNYLKLFFNDKSFEMSMYDLALQGKHNACNSMAAAIVGNVSGIRNEYIRECLSDFRGVEHRLEKYLTVHGSNTSTIRKPLISIRHGMHLNR
jgi:UDP-N-acetylmuramoylalanine--D-glutamate ligase